MTEFVYLDFETRSPVDIKAHGAYRYASHPDTDILCDSWMVGPDGDLRMWSPRHFWPTEKVPHRPLADLMQRIKAGAIVVGWNVAFERLIWNLVAVRRYGWPLLPIEQTLCLQALAEACCLPSKLEKAAEELDLPIQKDRSGKALINKLSKVKPEAPDWDPAWTDDMYRMRAYCGTDVKLLPLIHQVLRPMDPEEAGDYWVNEEINSRGVAVHLDFAEAAQKLSADELAVLDGEMDALTGGGITKLTQNIRKAKYLYSVVEHVDPLRQAMTKEEPTEENGHTLKISLDKPARRAIREWLEDDAVVDALGADWAGHVLDFLDLLDEGNSAAVKKFKAMVNRETDGRVCGMFSFNGAGQTGRYSSRGVQLQNIIRDPLVQGDIDAAVDAQELVLSAHFG